MSLKSQQQMLEPKLLVFLKRIEYRKYNDWMGKLKTESTMSSKDCNGWESYPYTFSIVAHPTEIVHII